MRSTVTVVVAAAVAFVALTTVAMGSSNNAVVDAFSPLATRSSTVGRQQQKQRTLRYFQKIGSDNNNNNNSRRCGNTSTSGSSRSSSNGRSTTALSMGLDLVTYLRTEFVSAALCTNQTPRSADVCLQLGCEDGRAVTFLPKTIETLITSTVEPDGVLPVSVRRQLTQQQQNRAGGPSVSFVDQRADDLSGTPDESVDVVISLQAAARMEETGLDWKKSVQEAARVLKPGGRFLFVEQSTMSNGLKYIEYVGNLGAYDLEAAMAEDNTDEENEEDEGDDDEDDEVYPTFECIGYDDVDFVITPHIAGVFVKSEDAGLTPEERKARDTAVEQEKMAEISLQAFERGSKKRRRKKKQKDAESTEV